ncbi:hypothetical protein [Rhodococcus rhodochrous]|uniref:FAD/NAD(P)-binding domain-containing protein n=1 Tax=Rhodococcus rhodochrous TaxID=1829 RepID=A0AA46X2K7_RHORH|nr:hypothetical protein [Rhodococcus rhodochrous]UZF48310.1 hypothetical protein KUM34_028645 [Rhodococcus rhodochrous]
MDTVEDPKTAETLLPDEYPIGVRRLCIDTGYYETFNRPNVSLVDIKADPIERITPGGIRLASGEEIELDVIVFALGFNAFTGALNEAGVRNEQECHQATIGSAVRGPSSDSLPPGSPTCSLSPDRVARLYWRI